MGNVFIVITIVVAVTLVIIGLVKLLFKAVELEEGTKQDMTFLAFTGFSLVLLLVTVELYIQRVLNG